MFAKHAVSTLMAAVVCSYLISKLIVWTQRWHGKLSLDGDTRGVQKFHEIPVPRIGGIALLIGILAASVFFVATPWAGYGMPLSVMLVFLALAAMPAFFAGLFEDMTKKVSVRARLLATFASALLASWLLGAVLTRVDIPGVDHLFAMMPLLALLFTAVAVAGVANSINIIDGFHGLAGTAVIIILLGLAWLAYGAGDMQVLLIALVGAASTFGFLLVNYPTGRLFLGDGGAYLAGFWVAEVAILLIARNPGVPAWQALAVCAFPVIEVFFSMYRKRILRNMSPTLPDKLHMHMLVYRRLVWRLVPYDASRPWRRNALVACVLGAWIGLFTVLAVSFGDSTVSAVVIIALNLAAYLAVYTRLVRGRWSFRRSYVVEPHDARDVSAKAGSDA